MCSAAKKIIQFVRRKKRPVGETFDDWGNFSQSHPNIKENDGYARTIYYMSMVVSDEANL